MEHLDVRPLEQSFNGQDVGDVLNSLGSWLSGQKFAKEKEVDNLERCVAGEKELEYKLKTLLRYLNFVVWLTTYDTLRVRVADKKQSSRPGFSILRSTGPNPAKVLNSIGPAYVIPIQISGSPRVSTRQIAKQAIVGEAIYITELVDVDPKMTFVIVVP